MDLLESGFAGTCAVVTGGSSGIGKACVLALARAGACVAFTYYSDPDEAHDVLAQVLSAGGRAQVRRVDVGDEAAVDAFFAEAERTYGPPRLLVNSAGVNMAGTRVRDMSLQQWETVIRADLTGPFLLCRRFARGLEGRGGGRIVNISSIHEDAPRTGAAGYDSAKGGLAQLTATLALELAPEGIAVNAVAPGMILTPMNQAALDDPRELARREAAIPWGRAGKPEEVADLVCYLLSSHADYITGATVKIDGALSLVVAPGA